MGQQDALGLGMKLDAQYHGLDLPDKFKMAVSGCHINCAESWVVMWVCSENLKAGLW
jgi:NAD(P)H-nitrite reductase large subunit